MSSTTVSNRQFERFIVGFFLLTPPIGGVVVLYYALQDLQKFSVTMAWLAYLVVLVSSHIKWVRPMLRRYPWLASYKEIAERSNKPRANGSTMKSRHPKLVQSALKNRLIRSAYRLSFTAALAPFFWQMYALHGKHFAWFFGMWLVAGFGITIGYHRVGTHPSFKTHPWMRAILFAMGSTAIQGLPQEWMKKHSKHHAFGETTADVHSPFVFEESKRSIFIEQFKGFMHSFMMWAFKEPSLMKPAKLTIDEWRVELQAKAPDPATFAYRPEDIDHWEVRDKKTGEIIVSTATLIRKRWDRLVEVIIGIEKDRVINLMSHPILYFAILSLGFIIPYFCGISFWESLARAAFVNWATFAVNSVCHLWGETPFEVPDNSRNNAFVEILALGEGGHNTHHKSELWAQHGVFPWQFDPSAIVIKTLAKLGLAWDLNLPTKQQLMMDWRKWRKREPDMQGIPIRARDIHGKTLTAIESEKEKVSV